MKRSEMIREIYYIISDNYHDGIVTDNARESAKEILAMMEKAGMKPPAIEKFTPQTGLFNGTMVHEWEEEW